MGDVYVGIDIGGTNTVIGLFDETVALIAKKVIPTPKPYRDSVYTDPTPFLDRLADEVYMLGKNTGYGDDLRYVGIGVPGKVDSAHGIVWDATNLGWQKVHLSSEMGKRMNMSVTIEHDVRCYAFGEAMAGAGMGCRNIICITIGTGIAAGIIVDGVVIRGSDYSAGEIGHDAVDRENGLCACGKIGCLETVVSATGIARMAEEAVQSGQLLSLVLKRGRITSSDVFHACLNGDRTAASIFDYVGTVLGRKLVSIVYLLNPEMIIIGGGVAAAGDILLNPLRNELWKQYPQQKPYLKVTKGQLDDTAGLIGAVHTVLKFKAKKQGAG